MNNESDRAPIGASPDVTGVLKAARDRIAARWIQDLSSIHDDHGNEIGWCSTGAIKSSVGHDYTVDPSGDSCMACRAVRLVEKAAGAKGALAAWNDTPGRTQAEVLAAFDRAIALSEGNAPEAPHGK